MTNNSFRKAGAFCMLLGIALFMSGCPVYVPDKALEQALKKASNTAFGPLTADALASITVVQASGLGISDLTGLEQCTRLQELYLADNDVQSLQPLSALTTLQVLDLGNNHVTNINALQNCFGLTSVSLWGANNGIADYSPLLRVHDGGGLSEGNVVLSYEQTHDADDVLLPSVATDIGQLIAAGVQVSYKDGDGNLVN